MIPRMMIYTAAAIVAAAIFAASSNFRGAVRVPPGAAVEFPGTAEAWPAGAFALEWWMQTAPDVGRPLIAGGPMGFTCGSGVCTAWIRGDLGTMMALSTTAVYPYSVYAVRVEAEDVGPDVHARLLLSGDVVAEGVIPGERLGASAPLLIGNLSGEHHLFIGPIRLWATASPPSWLFQDPAPTDPDLAGMWRQVSRGILPDDAGDHDGILLGAAAFPPLCWECGSTLVIFTDGFESGDTSRWE